MRYFSLLLFTMLFIGCTDEHSESQLSHLQIKESKFPHDILFMQRAYPTGMINMDAYKKAVSWKREQSVRAINATWEFVGPVNIGGRITDIEIPIDAPQTYFVGAASGGIFKTTDGGDNWAPIFDEQQMLSIGDIEISKTNTNLVWVGTGEVNAGGGSLAYDGDGIYKSNDGGTTWEVKGLPDVGSISKVLLDPNDDDIVFVGAMGPLFKNDPNRGVYRSTDGGTTWEQKLFVSDSTGIIDMAIHPANGDIVYAASWERIRRPQYRQYGGGTSGIYKSTDGGETWSELTNGLPTAASQKGRISIEIAASNPDVLYARYADASGSIQGVYRTDDGGDSWNAMNAAPLQDVGFHWWFQGIVVDPTDENTIYNVDFRVQKSTDGGMTWFDSFQDVHVDQHALAFNANVPGEVLLGNDGGLYYSPDGGASWSKEETLPITQFYRFYVDPSNENKIYGGAQDNSTSRTVTGSLDDWQIIYGGDGFQALVDPNNTNTIYAMYQYGNLAKSTNDGASFFGITSGISGSDRKNWDTPLVFDPQDSEILYTGTQRVYKSVNGGLFWTPISEDLTNGPGGGNLNYGTIISIDVSPFNQDKIIVGTDDGNIWYTVDGGVTWTNISNELPNRWVTKVLASRTHSGTIYATFSGYRYGENEGHVYATTDNGVTWNDISNNLPDIPVNDIVQSATGRLYLGTDIGVFGSGNAGDLWEALSEGMPTAVVTDMHIHEASNYLYAATYGRSSFKLNLEEVILGNAANALENDLQIAPNPVLDFFEVNTEEWVGARLSLFSIEGKKILERELTTRSKRIDVHSLSQGMYIVRIQKNNQAINKKLVKR